MERCDFMKERIVSPNAPYPTGPYSQGVKMNGLVFVSGQDGVFPNGELAGKTIKDQTTACLKNVETILNEAGAKLDNIVHMTCHLHELTEENVHEFNQAYEAYFSSVEVKPARITVGSELLETRVEITAIAAISDS